MNPEGLLIVDKPPGLTSHDVVSRVRRIVGVRRVGHAGTLDPMATGVLVLGIGRATRLLGHLALGDKDYLAGIALGVRTTTDDAEGEVLAAAADEPGMTAALKPTWSPEQLATAVAKLTGSIAQVPPAFSAIKIGGQRAYAKARAGESVQLAARNVTVGRFVVTAIDGDELTAEITCSSGTYVRALARDLGAALGTGAHLSALRRTRVGGFGLDSAVPLDALAQMAAAEFPIIGLADAVATAFPRRDLSADQAVDIGYGRRLERTGMPGVYGAFGPDGAVLALIEDRDEQARPVVVFEAKG